MSLTPSLTLSSTARHHQQLPTWVTIENEETDLDEEAEEEIRRKGYNVVELPDYVGQLTERPHQQDLQHPERNRHVNKCVSFDN